MKDAEILDEITDVIVNHYGEEDEPFSRNGLKQILDSVVEILDKRESLGRGGTDVSLGRLTDQRIQDEPAWDLPVEPEAIDPADDGPEVDILRSL